MKVVVVLLALVSVVAVVYGAPLQFTGANEAGAEFGSAGSNAYAYPSPASYQHLQSIGMNIFRVPFLWERLQPDYTSNTFNSNEQTMLVNSITDITSKGAYAIIDPHNYARFPFNGNPIGSSGGPSNAQFANFWSLLATLFKNNPRVMFGIMNEPHDTTGGTQGWLDTANAAIAAIRATGATQLILVPGNGYTGAWSWSAPQAWYGSANADVMKGVQDSGKNFAFEVHQYFDNGYSGGSDSCVTTDPSNLLTSLTAWARSNQFKVFVGEFGAGNNTNCQQCISNFLTYLEANNDVYIGWTYWAAGPLWGDYFTSIEPTNGQDKPQTAWLVPHLAGASGSAAPSSSQVPVSTTASISPAPGTSASISPVPGSSASVSPAPGLSNSPVGSSQIGQSYQPPQPSQTRQPQQPSQSSQPQQPSQSSQPQQPSQTRQPQQPSQSAQPGQPSQSAQPGQPSQSAQPGQPSQSSQPGQPSQSSQPGQPSQSSQPGQPSQSSQPSYTSVPNGQQPQQPSQTSQPYSSPVTQSIYIDKLQNDWQITQQPHTFSLTATNYTFAQSPYSLSWVAGSDSSDRMVFTCYNAQCANSADYYALSFYVNSGRGSGQQFYIQLMQGTQLVGSQIMLTSGDANTWNQVILKFSGDWGSLPSGKIDGFTLTGSSNSANQDALFIDNIYLLQDSGSVSVQFSGINPNGNKKRSGQDALSNNTADAVGVSRDSAYSNGNVVQLVGLDSYEVNAALDTNTWVSKYNTNTGSNVQPSQVSTQKVSDATMSSGTSTTGSGARLSSSSFFSYLF